MVVKHPDLHYYQGYHDLITVLVLVLTEDERLCFSVAERISLHFLRDVMRPSFDVLQPLMMLLFPLIRRFDGELADFLDASGVQAFVALPWVITWFAHDVMDLDVVARLFDAFLASPPLLPLYLSAAVIMHRREEVMRVECDFSTVHSTLAKLPPSLPYDDLLQRARAMIHTLPPARLARAAGSKELLLLWSKGQITVLQHAPGGLGGGRVWRRDMVYMHWQGHITPQTVSEPWPMMFTTFVLLATLTSSTFWAMTVYDPRP